MNTIKFTCTALPNGKIGKLQCDPDGYYTVVVGGLNCFNSAGEYYVYEGAKQLFEESSSFMRRVKNGTLYGERGHPKKQPGMTDDQYVNRIMSVHEETTSHHFKEIWLDLDYGKNNPSLNNPKLIAIMAKVKPSGPMGQYLKDSFDNPAENVCFSIRAFTQDVFDGKVNRRTLVRIETFDGVIEGGIATANKYSTPGLESLLEKTITVKELNKLANSPVGIATESVRNNVKELLSLINTPKIEQPLFANW